MNYAVRIFKNLPTKLSGAPDNYPAEIRPLGSLTVLPADPGWQLMDQTQLNAAKATSQDAFNRWQAREAITPMDQNHEVDAYNTKGYITSQIWYRTKISSGVYTDKAREILYTYDSTGSAIVTKVENLYDDTGTLYDTITTNLLMDTAAAKKVIFEKA